jgi:hypothetical protein
MYLNLGFSAAFWEQAKRNWRRMNMFCLGKRSVCVYRFCLQQFDWTDLTYHSQIPAAHAIQYKRAFIRIEAIGERCLVSLCFRSG